MASSISKSPQWKDEPVHQTYNFYKQYLEQQIVIEATAISAGMAAGAATAKSLKLRFLKRAAKLFGKYVPKHIYIRIASGAFGLYTTYKASKEMKEYLLNHFANKTEEEIAQDFELRERKILKYNKEKKPAKLHNALQSLQSYLIQYGNFKILPLVSDRDSIFRKISVKLNLDLYCTLDDKKSFLSEDETMPNSKLIELISKRMSKVNFASVIDENSPEITEAINKVDRIIDIIESLETPLKESYLLSFNNYKKELESQLIEEQNFALVKHDLEVEAVEKLLYVEPKSEFDLPYRKSPRSIVCQPHLRRKALAN